MTTGLFPPMSQNRDTGDLLQSCGFREVRRGIRGAAGRVRDDKQAVGRAKARKMRHVRGVDGGGLGRGEAVIFVEDECTDGRRFLR